MAEGNPLNRYEFAGRGAYDPRIVEDYIARAAMARGMDPEIALRVARSEGLRGYVGDEGSSFGPFQLHYGNVAGGGNRVSGLGDVFTQQTGLDARDPSTWRHQVDFSLDQAAKGGWSPWHGWKGSQWAGIPGDHKAAQLYETGRFVPQAEPIQYAGMRPPPGQEVFSDQPMAYAEAPPPPFFPSLKQAPQVTPQHFFEGGEIPGQEAPPAQQQPIQVQPTQPAEYTLQDVFSGKEAPAPTAAAPAPAATQVQGEVQAAPGGDWGFAKEFIRGGISGLTGGVGDVTKAAATVEALRGGFSDFGARRRQIIEREEAARKAYEQENPMAAMVASGLGAGVGTLAPMGAVTGALGMGAKAAAAAAPRLAPAIEAVGTQLAGKGTLLGGAPSQALQGAAYGAGEAALTQKLVPEEERGLKSIGYGALGGGAVGGVLGATLGQVGKSFTSYIPQERKDLAKMARDKFGLDLHVAQVAEDPKVKQLYEEVVPNSVQTAQIKKWNEKVAEKLGMKGEAFTGTNVDNAMDKYGSNISKFVTGETTKLDKPFQQTYNPYMRRLLARDGTGLSASDPLRQHLRDFHNELLSDLSGGLQMKGEMLQNYIKRGGRIDRKFPFSGQDPLNKQVAHDLREMFIDAFERSAPQKILDDKKFRETREIYKGLAAVKSLVGQGDVGVINPKALLKKVERRGIKGELSELARIGQYMPESGVTGAAKGGSKFFDKRSLYEGLTGIAATAGSQYLGVPYGYALAGAAATDMARRGVQAGMMPINVLNRMAMEGTPMFQLLQQSGNVLTGAGAAGAAGAGSMESGR